MDLREKLIDLIHKARLSMWGKNGLSNDLARNSYIAEYLIANSVTMQEWISVEIDLPKYTNEYNVLVGVPNEFGYFEKVTTLRFERINGKEPRWVIPKNEIYNVISWMPLPEPPKGD